MKKIIAALALLSVMASSSLAANKVIKFGVYQPLSGDSGAGGKQEVLGITYAQSKTPTVEIGGETYDIQLVYADNGSATDKAPSAAQHLVSEGVSVVLGSYGSAVCIAGSKYFEQAGIPAITGTSTNPQVTAGNKHYFRICFLDPFQGVVLANYVWKVMGVKNAYCLAELGNDYDVGLVHYFEEEFTRLGGSVISDTFPTGTSDFTSYLTNATSYGSEVFFCPTSIAYSTQIGAQAAGQGVTFPILGGDTLDSNKVVESIKGTDVKLIISTFYQEGADPEFDAGFKAYLDSNPENIKNNGGNDMIAAVSVMAHDVYNVAVEAVKAAQSTDPRKINDAIWGVKIKGVSGEIAFNETGDAIRDSAVLKEVDTKAGEWKFLCIQKVGD